jgi:outer membrane biosynthesis protein TonB
MAIAGYTPTPRQQTRSYDDTKNAIANIMAGQQQKMHPTTATAAQPKQLQQPVQQQPKPQVTQPKPEIPKIPPVQPKPQPKPVVQQPVVQQPKPQSQQAAQQQPKTEKKSHRFQMRMTQQQHNKVKRLKKAWKLNTEAAVIDKLLTGCDEAEKPTSTLCATLDELTAIHGEIHRIGLNINQIAKTANSSALTASDVQKLEELTETLLNAIYSVREGGVKCQQ